MKHAVHYLIKSGKALDLVREHIKNVLRVREEVRALGLELGSERVTFNRSTGVLTGVVFPDAKHPDFKARDSKGLSYPKKGSEWAKRFAAQKGHPEASEIIEDAFGVPMSIEYSCDDGSHGSSFLGNMVEGCGFLYLSVDGPYALWIPDVAGAVAEYEAMGRKVEEPAKGFSMEIPGCQRIEDEKWDLMVAQHKLDQKKKAREAQAALVVA